MFIDRNRNKVINFPTQEIEVNILTYYNKLAKRI